MQNYYLESYSRLFNLHLMDN